jgi:hypothetical protein
MQARYQSSLIPFGGPGRVEVNQLSARAAIFKSNPATNNP